MCSGRRHAPAEQLRRESEQTKDGRYPAGGTGRRPNRQKVYSVRLGVEEEAEVQSVAAKHLPPQRSSAPGSSNRSTANAPPGIALSAAMARRRGAVWALQGWVMSPKSRGRPKGRGRPVQRRAPGRALGSERTPVQVVQAEAPGLVGADIVSVRVAASSWRAGSGRWPRWGIGTPSRGWWGSGRSRPGGRSCRIRGCRSSGSSTTSSSTQSPRSADSCAGARPSGTGDGAPLMTHKTSTAISQDPHHAGHRLVRLKVPAHFAASWLPGAQARRTLETS